MQNYGLAFHVQLKSILCTSHHIILKRTYVTRHLELFHSGIRINHKAIAQAMDEWNVSYELPVIEPGHTVTQLQGLPIEIGYSCTQCHFITISHRKFKDHMSQQLHSNNDNKIFLLPVQRLNQNTIPFPIHPVTKTAPSASVSAFVHGLMSQVDNAYKIPTGQFTTNKRLVTPFLLGTKWLDIVQNHVITKLIALRATPTAGDGYLARASSVVKRMTHQAIAAIPLIPELILQRLNTSDPIKGYGFSALNKLV